MLNNLIGNNFEGVLEKPPHLQGVRGPKRFENPCHRQNKSTDVCDVARANNDLIYVWLNFTFSLWPKKMSSVCHICNLSSSHVIHLSSWKRVEMFDHVEQMLRCILRLCSSSSQLEEWRQSASKSYNTQTVAYHTTLLGPVLKQTKKSKNEQRQRTGVISYPRFVCLDSCTNVCEDAHFTEIYLSSYLLSILTFLNIMFHYIFWSRAIFLRAPAC